MNRRHKQSNRPSVEYRHEQEYDEIDPDEAEVMAVLSIPRGRERDMRVIELEDGALALYMELFYIPGDTEIYRESTRSYWRYVAEHQDIYNADGSRHWGRDELKHA
jgi:hypothetical protein